LALGQFRLAFFGSANYLYGNWLIFFPKAPKPAFFRKSPFFGLKSTGIAFFSWPFGGPLGLFWPALGPSFLALAENSRDFFP
jgi:hypothetical protein